MAECACLENRRPFTGSVGSNPTSSVPKKTKATGLWFFFGTETSRIHEDLMKYVFSLVNEMSTVYNLRI